MSTFPLQRNEYQRLVRDELHVAKDDREEHEYHALHAVAFFLVLFLCYACSLENPNNRIANVDDGVDERREDYGSQVPRAYLSSYEMMENFGLLSERPQTQLGTVTSDTCQI